MRLNELMISAADAVSVERKYQCDNSFLGDDAELGSGLLEVLDTIKAATHWTEHLVSLLIMRANRRVIDRGPSK
ncbi:hypothetical protein [Paramagnetospirillum magneticum]|uniref:hypothetical protein n=1 Tax=Paramagnetospirillum magneticum TaxID=84159 RepID=UPI0011D0FFF8|nr:hypothetical protein [Paramagnetospirillum magneticum]